MRSELAVAVMILVYTMLCVLFTKNLFLVITLLLAILAIRLIIWWVSRATKEAS